MSKAWAVNDYDRERGAVVYAETRGKARAEGATEIESEFLEVEARRSPEFDGMEPQPSDAELLAAGWWLHCRRAGCLQRVHEHDVVMGGDDAYCSEACRDQASERGAA